MTNPDPQSGPAPVSAPDPVPIAGEGPSERQIATAINGLVVCSATLAASAASERFRVVAITTLVTGIVFWAAESYSQGVARRAVKKASLGWPDVRAIAVQEWPMVSATFVPLGALLLAGALGASVSTAVYVALGVVIVLLAAAGCTASWESGIRGVRLVASTFLTALLGLVMVALKYFVLH